MDTLFDVLCYDFACANNYLVHMLPLFLCSCFIMYTYLGVEIKMSTSNDGNQDESGSDEDFMVAYIALELMGSSTSAAKKEMVPTVPRMTGIQGVETQLNDRVECYNMHRMSCRYAVHICCHGLGWICS